MSYAPLTGAGLLKLHSFNAEKTVHVLIGHTVSDNMQYAGMLRQKS